MREGALWSFLPTSESFSPGGGSNMGDISHVDRQEKAFWNW